MRTEGIRLQNVSVRAGMETILKNVSFTVYRDEITCLYVPEMKCRNMMIQCLSKKKTPNEGSTWFDKSRMLTVTKESKLVPQMSIGENLFLNSDEVYSCGYLKKGKMYRLAEEILKEAHLGHMNPRTPVYLLSDVEKNYIELLKGISEKAGILLIEDITGLYRAYETERLKTLIGFLKEKGIMIIYITDKIADILDIAERLIFIWNGTVIENTDCGPDSRAQEKIMKALAVKETGAYKSVAADKLLLRMEEDGRELMSVGKEEILGVYDEMWKKTPKITDFLSGRLSEDTRGLTLFHEGKRMNIENCQDALQKGFAMIGEKNQNRQIFYNMNLIDNITIMAEDTIIAKGILQSERLKRFLACEALNKIGYGSLVQKYGTLKKLPELESDVELVIAVARLLCTGPRVISFINPYLSLADANVSQFQAMLMRLKAGGISCIIYSRHIKQLENLVDRIITI